MKILIVEDEKKIAQFARKALEEQGFTVTVCHDGHEGYDRVTHEAFDVVLLDIMLPGRDGLSILSNLRKQGNTVPVILLTARAELEERVEGLNAGADDYLTKPFFVDELVARIHAVARRTGEGQLSLIELGPVKMNLVTREVDVNSERIELTPREFNLLEVLLRSPGRVFTRAQLLERVWGYDFDPQTNMVDVNIRRLRKKVALPKSTHPHAGPLIETVRGVGYRARAEFI